MNVMLACESCANMSFGHIIVKHIEFKVLERSLQLYTPIWDV